MPTIKMMKKDAVFPVQIGAGMVQRLQQLMMSLASQRTPEELDRYRKSVFSSKSPDLEESWMEDLFTVSMLVSAIEMEAEKAGVLYEKDIDEITQPES